MVIMQTLVMALTMGLILYAWQLTFEAEALEMVAAEPGLRST